MVGLKRFMAFIARNASSGVWTGLQGTPAHWKQPPACDMLRFEPGFPHG